MEEAAGKGREKEMRRPMIEEEKTIARIMEKKEEEEEKNVIELRATEEIVP